MASTVASPKVILFDASGNALVTASGRLGVDIATLPLPLGAATDSVLQTIRDEIGAINANPVANTLQDRLKTLLAAVDTLETTLTSIDSKVATAAKQDTLIAKDFATETKLEAIRQVLTTLATQATLSTLSVKDFATQATLAQILSEFQGSGGQAQEGTLQAIRDAIGQLNSNPDSLSLQGRIKILATENTLALIKTAAALRDNKAATLLHLLPTVPTDELQVYPADANAPVSDPKYHLRAPEGTLVTATAWEAVRFDRNGAGQAIRVRYRSTGVRADDPSLVGW